jgi:hypothetical protein
VTELIVVSALSLVLLAVLANLYKGICLPTRDAARRCRVALRANLAFSALAQDLGGNLVDPYTSSSFQTVNPTLLARPEGTSDWRFVCWDVSDPTVLRLYFRPGTDDDTTAAGKVTDALITYASVESQSGYQLLRTNSVTGTTVTVAEGLVAATPSGGTGFSCALVNDDQWLSITLVFSAVGIAPKVSVNDQDQLTYYVVVQPPASS